MAEFDAETRQRCERVDDESTAVAGIVIALVGHRFELEFVERTATPRPAMKLDIRHYLLII